MKTNTKNIINLFPKTYQYLSVHVFFIFIFASVALGMSFSAQAETIITNTASANFSINGTAKTLSDSVQFTKDQVVAPSDEITLTKQANVSNSHTGDTITYTLEVGNPNSKILSQVIIQDTLPPSISFQAGTVTINNNLISNSLVQLSGNQLSITVGEIPAKETWSISYKATANSTGTHVNQAYALSDTANSQKAESTVSVTAKERTPSVIEFLRIDNTTNGIKSIIPPTAYNDNQNGGKHWLEVDSVTLPDGTTIDLPSPQHIVDTDQYSLSEPIVIQVRDIDQNRDPSKLETIVVTVTVPGTTDVEVLLLRETAPDSGIFRGILLTTSGPIDIQNGVLSLKNNSRIKVNYFDREDSNDVSATAAFITPDPQLVLTKKANKQSATIGELVRYKLTFKNTGNYNIPNIIVDDKLPIGFALIPNSTTLNGQKLNQQVIQNGRSLSISLGQIKIGEQWILEYLTKITSSVKVGDAVNQAQIKGGDRDSNIARATVVIKDDLMRSKNLLTGRVFIGCETGKDVDVLSNVRIYLETGRNILSDKEGFWHMEGVKPGKHVLQLDTNSLPEGYEAIICQGNTRYARNSESRFVDLQAGSLWRVDFHVKKVNTDSVNSVSTQIKKGVKPFGDKYLKTATDKFEILWPINNYIPPLASTKIYIKSPAKHTVDVFLNGKRVSPLNYDGSDTNKSRTVTIRRWMGVDIDINRRDNKLLAILRDKSGQEITRKTHNIHFSGKPASAEFLERKSVLVADGKTIPVIALRIRDEDGFIMRANTHGYFTLKNSRFTVKTQNNENKKINLNESLSGSYKYLIMEGGIARIELNPTTQTGELKLNLKFSDRKNKTITAWLKPELRDWILVGLAEGTAGYKTVSGNIKTQGLDKADKFYKRGRVAFFAKGKVKGKYLLTLAYDSHKQKYKAGDQLNGDIDPDSWYTVYADSSRSQYDAPSSRKLYVKIEKSSFYALFGDYRTGMNVTELAKFERTLNGLKSEYKSKNLQYNGFISETSNNHHHREIPGDGTSGLYHLSSGIIPNSETIRIETRDRFHSERILETRELVRFQDYDIDYDAGTLFFKFPVTGRDSNFDPNIIIVDYDSESDSNKNIVAGGRVAVTTNNEKLEVGLSTIQLSRKNTKNDSLIAIDATYKINPSTKVHAEIAQSKTLASNNKSINAQIIEIEKDISNLEARLYYRKQGSNFGINSQSSEIGTKKIGAELKYKLNDRTNINAELSKQNNLTNDNKRQLAEISINQRYDKFEIDTGIRHSKEKLAGNSTDNNTLLLGGRYTTENGRVTLRANIEKNLKDKNKTEQSPDRAVVGVDVKLKRGITLFAEHEATKNDDITTQNSRVGVTKDLWHGAKGRSTFTQERTDQGQRNYATLGLSQKIKVNEKINADISIDHAKTIGDNIQRFNPNEPNAQGTQRDDYTAFSVGLGSNDEDWSWTTRAELRKGDLNDKVNLYGGLIRRLKDGKNLSAKMSYTDSQDSNGDYNKKFKLSLGSAWHPKEKDFTFFNRLDLIDEEKRNDSDKEHTQKVVHNLHYNRQFNEKTQFSIHHGIKHVFDENTDGNDKSKTHSTIDTATLELRRDITKAWDIGAHVGYLHDWSEKNIKTVAGVSVGVTPAENAWLQLGFNFEGFDDDDFDGNDYKHKGIYTSFSYKFDQDTLRRKDRKVNSKISPAEGKADAKQLNEKTDTDPEEVTEAKLIDNKVDAESIENEIDTKSTEERTDEIIPKEDSTKKVIGESNTLDTQKNRAEKSNIKYVKDLFDLS